MSNIGPSDVLPLQGEVRYRVRQEGVVNMDTECPHCHQQLPGERKRQFKCPACQEPVHVRTKHGLVPRHYFTEAEARAVDGLSKNGATRAEFEANRQALAESYGFDPSLPDVLWRVMNSRIATLRDPHELKMHYFQMGLILHGEGKDPRRMLQESRRWELEGYKRGLGRPAKVKIIAIPEDSCEACLALHRQTLTVAEALASSLLPVATCTHAKNAGGFGWCRCWYSFTL